MKWGESDRGIHKPVLVKEILSLFAQRKSPQKILDCTFGRGGHSLALLKTFPQVGITAIDCDDQAIEYGLSLKAVQQGNIQLSKGIFHSFAKETKEQDIYDMILMDLGVSSPQLEEGKRGFSFYQEGPLDMRMDTGQSLKAEDIINSWSKEELIQLFQNYGEIQNPSKVVCDILKERKRKKIQSTFELSSLIQKHQPHHFWKKHPATKWFLALRLAVNQELEGLSKCLPDFVPLLKDEAYFVVISFHSLEDRIVKKTFRQFVLEGRGKLWNKKVIRPGVEEKKKNIRSRSAKMRVFQKKTAIPQ